MFKFAIAFFVLLPIGVFAAAPFPGTGDFEKGRDYTLINLLAKQESPQPQLVFYRCSNLWCSQRHFEVVNELPAKKVYRKSPKSPKSLKANK